MLARLFTGDNVRDDSPVCRRIWRLILVDWQIRGRRCTGCWWRSGCCSNNLLSRIIPTASLFGLSLPQCDGFYKPVPMWRNLRDEQSWKKFDCTFSLLANDSFFEFLLHTNLHTHTHTVRSSESWFVLVLANNKLIKQKWFFSLFLSFLLFLFFSQQNRKKI